MALVLPAKLVKEKYVQEILQLRRDFVGFTPATQRLDGILRNIIRLQRHQLPHQLPDLILAPTQFYQWALPRLAQLALTPNQLSAQFMRLDRCLQNYRQFLQTYFGFWGQITQEVAAGFARLPGKHYLEVMAGNGYLSYGLRRLHQQVYTTDSLSWTGENQTGRQPWTTVAPLDACKAYHKYRDDIDYVVMVWSPDGVPVDWQLLQLMRQDQRQIPLLCVGERNGCTNSKQFWQAAHFVNNPEIQRLNQCFSPLDLVREQVFWIE